jgi:hypothetical protein
MAPPPRKSGSMLIPVIAIIGVILVLVVVAGTVIVVASSSKGSPNPSGIAGASATLVKTKGPSAAPTKTVKTTSVPVTTNEIIMSPHQWRCTATSATITVVIRLASTFVGTDMIYPEVDGDPGTGSEVSKNFTKQSDGTWKETETLASSDFCTNLTLGDHTLGVMDADDVVLAETDFTMDA